MNEPQPALELAHVMPGRMRFRWKGALTPPAELLSELRELPDVTRLEFRPASRSVVLQHINGLNVDAIRDLAGRFSVPVCDPPPPPTLASRRRTEPPVDGKWGPVVADLEAVLLLGLLVSWVRDLVTTRTLRVGTILLIFLTGLNLYQYWQRRQARARAEGADRTVEGEVSPAEMELLAT